MPCLDMRDGRVVKGVRFVDIQDAGDPVECCRAYCAAGADAIAMLDIAATAENRPTLLEVVRRVAAVATVPLTVGGGIRDTASAAAVLAAGADKISISSSAFRRPAVMGEIIRECGRDAVVAAIDAAANPTMPSGYEVWIDGGRTATGADAVEWARCLEDIGVSVILPTSKSADGVRSGYDLPLLRALRKAVKVQLVASGGAGKLEHFYEAVEAGADILLAASVFHFGIISIPQLKQYLRSRGVAVS
jgi:cyclase